MRIFKTRLFAKWAKKEKITDDLLRQSVSEMERGLVDANLGSHVYKKRLPSKGQGKRGGARTILVYQISQKVFFVFGYSKNEKANITDEEKKLAKELAKEMLAFSDRQLSKLIEAGKLIEVKYDG